MFSDISSKFLIRKIYLWRSGIGNGIAVSSHKGGGSISTNEGCLVGLSREEGTHCANPVGKLADSGDLLEGDERILQQKSEHT